LLKIMLSATEVSGDMHGANLAKAIKKLRPEAYFIGIGGERMVAAGVDVKVFATHMGTIGIVEGLKYYPSFLKIKLKIEKLLKEEKPDLLILIDSRDFNLNLIGPAKRLGIPVVYYFAPPVWAWQDWRMMRAAKKIDRIIAIFPFEERIYKKVGADVLWVGHPLLDIVRPTMNKEKAYKKFAIDPSQPVVGLLPGSREYEINGLLPVMLGAAERLKRKMEKVQYFIPVAASFFQEKIAKMVERSEVRVKILNDNIYDIMNISSLLITASGTATLEAVCLDTPMVIIYKTHITTYILGKILLKIPYVGLPNILAGKKIVPELLQFKAKEEGLVDVVFDLLVNSEKLNKMRIELREVLKKLGSPGATERAAQAVLEVAVKKGRAK